MRKYAGILALGLVLDAAAQEAVPAAALEDAGNVQDTALASSLRKQGESAYVAQQEPNYRTREPARTAGTSREIVSGKGSELSPDKAARGNGDW